MKNTSLIVIAFLFANTFFAQSSITLKLQSAIDDIYQKYEDAVGIMVHVEAPEQGVSWSGASGYANQKRNRSYKLTNLRVV